MANTIYDQLVKDGKFKTFIRLIDICDGLKDNLSGKDQLTVFAPTDDAFSKLQPGTVEKYSQDTDLLLDIFRFHMIVGTHTSEELLVLAKSKQTMKALDNNPMVLEEKDGLWVGNEKRMAKVSTADIKTSNGVIHVIDDLLSL
ncbi:MAG: fasciclin domain-containing protein [Candidatus Dojkabacteria bacterium]